MRKLTALLRSETPITYARSLVPCQVSEYQRLPDGQIEGLSKLLGATYPDRHWDAQTVRNVFINDGRVKAIWIATENNRPIGVAAAQVRADNGSDSVNVHWISVHPEWKHKGIGRMMMVELWRWAMLNAKRRVWAYTTTYTLEVEEFYRDLGFVTTHLPSD